MDLIQSERQRDADKPRKPSIGIGEQVLRWLLTDFIWATLPLCVLFLVALLNPPQPASGFENRPFFANVEWSFASITLFAACLRELLRVRMEVQRQGSLMVTGAMIAGFSAIVVLNTTVLGIIYSERLGATMNMDMVQCLQGIFFFLAIAATIFVFYFESRVRQGQQMQEDRHARKLEEIQKSLEEMRR